MNSYIGEGESALLFFHLRKDFAFGIFFPQEKFGKLFITFVCQITLRSRQKKNTTKQIENNINRNNTTKQGQIPNLTFESNGLYTVHEGKLFHNS